MTHLEYTGTRPSGWPLTGKLRTDAQFSEMGQWYRARTVIADAIRTTSSMSAALLATGLDMARECTHPDAKWICSVLDGRIINDRGHLYWLFANMGDAQGGAALFFSACFSCGDSRALFRRSADLGYGPAMTFVCCNQSMPPDQVRSMCERAADQGDPAAWHLLAMHWFAHGSGCTDVEKALTYLYNAAEAGVPASQEIVGRLCKVTDPEKCEWFHRAALGGRITDEGYVNLIQGAMGGGGDENNGHANYYDNLSRMRATYRVGKNLIKNIDLLSKTLYGLSQFQSQHGGVYRVAGSTFNFAVLAVRTFVIWERETRQAVFAWAACANRLDVLPPEVCLIISQLVWESRCDGLYELK